MGAPRLVGAPGAARARTRAAAVALALALVVLSTGCQTGVWTGSGSTSVAVIGDSLVFQAEGNTALGDGQRLLADELVASGYRSFVTGWVGATTTTGHDWFWAEADVPELDVLVIALGTNDVHDDVPLATSRAMIHAWLAEVADLGCVALVGIDESADAWGLDVDGPPFDQMLAEEAEAAGNAIFVPWEPDPTIHGTTGNPHFATDAAKAEYRTFLHGVVDTCAATLS